MECQTKRCKACFRDLPVEEFHIAHGTTRRGVCRDCRNEKARRRYPAFRERKQRAGKAWYERNREKRIRQILDGRDAEAHAAWYREYRQRPEVRLRLREKNAARRAGGAYRDSTRLGSMYARVLERDGMTCHICGKAIEGLDDLHFDHVHPLSRGGEHSEKNVRPAHRICNLRKAARKATRAAS